MGGHGAWQIGSLYPDRFAAIGPSAGWLSFDSYRASARLSHHVNLRAGHPRPLESLNC